MFQRDRSQLFSTDFCGLIVDEAEVLINAFAVSTNQPSKLGGPRVSYLAGTRHHHVGFKPSRHKLGIAVRALSSTFRGMSTGVPMRNSAADAGSLLAMIRLSYGEAFFAVDGADVEGRKRVLGLVSVRRVRRSMAKWSDDHLEASDLQNFLIFHLISLAYSVLKQEEAAKDQARARARRGEGRDPGKVLKALRERILQCIAYCRMASVAPLLLDADDLAAKFSIHVRQSDLESVEQNPKLARVLADVRSVLQADGAKQSVLVFCEFRALLQAVERHLGSSGRGPLARIIDGSTSAEERVALVDEFQTGESFRVLCLGKAAGNGLNLQRASLVVLTSPWWNNAQDEQWVGRADRKGQTKEVRVVTLFTRSFIEKCMVVLGSKKSDEIHQHVGGVNAHVRLRGDALVDDKTMMRGEDDGAGGEAKASETQVFRDFVDEMMQHWTAPERQEQLAVLTRRFQYI